MEDISRVMEIIRTLRGENGCAWDRKQTPLTMWKCLAEEMYELRDAIVNRDDENACEEMGDVLFQILFIMEIFHEQKRVPFEMVVDTIAKKMIRRHPHVYGRARVESEADLLNQWEAIKAEEKNKRCRDGEKKQTKDGAVSALDSVPKGMPGLMRAMQVSKAAVKQGFDWENIHGVMETVKEEISEFEAALEEKDTEGAMLEFGDILFTLVNVARFAGFHPETALSQSTAKFEGRFRQMENDLSQKNLLLRKLSAQEREIAWANAKKRYGR